jgi:TRAP-type C4-dicarboxylate transport system permease small subunit
MHGLLFGMKGGIMRRSVASGLMIVLTTTLHIAAALALMSMMMVVVANIIGRIFFRSPVAGTLEIAGFAGVVVAAVAVAFAERAHRNVAVDVVVRSLAPRVRKILDTITYLLSLGAIGILLWAASKSAVEWLRTGERTLTLGIRLFPFGFIWAFGLFCLCALLLQHVIQCLMKRVRK